MSNRALPGIVCHRGAGHVTPENTMASARQCIEWGMDVLELDVNRSRDGVHYVFHGPDLARTTNGIGRINESDSAMLDTLDAGSWFDPAFADERIPRLDEMLRFIDGRIRLFIDVKRADLAELTDTLRRYRHDDAFFWFGREDRARDFVDLRSGFDLKINVRTPDDVERAASEWGARLVEVGPDNLTPSLVDTAHELGLRVMVLEAGDPARIEAALEQGVDLLNVDRADEVRAIVNNWAKRQD